MKKFWGVLIIAAVVRWKMKKDERRISGWRIAAYCAGFAVLVGMIGPQILSKITGPILRSKQLNLLAGAGIICKMDQGTPDREFFRAV